MSKEKSRKTYDSMCPQANDTLDLKELIFSSLIWVQRTKQYFLPCFQNLNVMIFTQSPEEGDVYSQIRREFFLSAKSIIFTETK